MKTTYEANHLRARESRLGVYLGILMHAPTWKKTLTEKLHNLGISTSYKRLIELSTIIENIY